MKGWDEGGGGGQRHPCRGIHTATLMQRHTLHPEVTCQCFWSRCTFQSPLLKCQRDPLPEQASTLSKPRKEQPLLQRPLRGMDVAISESHEQAVVSAGDRRVFRRMLADSLERQGLSAATSQKDRSKRSPWV